ncbi:FAD-dependent oxidoreductase [Bremerella sp. P1]|uniref:FAD-dependent oxidoreductase n=1 Tax=Bremerella sp. P1 TaxID=3026424 RepID=UPI002367CE5A|nr:FAD-dependent oxidoreductase [Bremerella sp. P1]WDI41156.1 FAD-dependent oxidoreductase [Bremerella sp. P1]
MHRLQTQSENPRSVSTEAARMVVVGNGMVGHAFCQSLVRRGAMQEWQVDIFGEEPYAAYDRVRLTQLFSDTESSLTLSPKTWYEQVGLNLVTSQKVNAIDRINREVVCQDGKRYPYDRLVLATGSRPFVPPIEGAELPGVFLYRTLDDLQKIRTYAENCRSAAIMGGGLLGLEAGKAALDLGLEAHVLEVAPSLMPRQLDTAGGALLKSRVESLGVHVHVLCRCERIERFGEGLRLHFTNSETLRVDMLIISAGIVPRDELARDAELEIAHRGGVVVNDQLRTSDPHIYAIGECAVHREKHYGLVGPGIQMADVLAANCCGEKQEFLYGDQSAKLKLMGVDVAALGDALGETPNSRIVASSTEHSYRKLIFEGNCVVGATAVGEWDEIDRVRDLITHARRLWPWQISRFRRTGRLWPEDTLNSPWDWPDNAVICSCVGVTKGQICEATRDGAADAAAVTTLTRASSVCGTCRPLVRQLCGERHLPPKTASWQILLASSVATLMIIVAMLAIGPLPFADSVQSTWHTVDALWRSETPKQITGYTIFGLTALGLAFSLRKRISRITWGDFAWWRVAHAVLATLAVVGLVLHTGFHFGSNLNFALALTFVVVNFTGSLTGMLVSLENRITGALGIWIRRWRPRLVWLHLILSWPLPVLLLFHIITVYYF